MLIKLFAVILVSMFATGPIIHSGLAGVKVRQKQQQKATRYACPMDPEVASAKPGICPKCGMALRLVADNIDAGAARSGNTTDEGSKNSPSISSSRIPDVRVFDQHGKALRFYSDLVKGKTVAVNFIFTTCTTICPPLTATFRRVQQSPMERAPDVELISISVDPVIDTPERLREFAAKFKTGPRWTFVTGEKYEIDQLLRALG